MRKKSSAIAPSESSAKGKHNAKERQADNKPEIFVHSVGKQTPSWFGEQGKLLRKDPWLCAMLTLLPALTAFLLWWIFSAGIAVRLPIGVVDFDHSRLSQQFLTQVSASPSLYLSHEYTDMSQAKAAMQRADIYAFVVIPAQFSQTLYQRRQPKIALFYNAQFILIGKMIQSAFLSSALQVNASIETLQNLAQGNQTLTHAIAQAVPIVPKPMALFNPNLNYSRFLIATLIPSLWQIFIVASTILILAANKQQQSVRQWLGHYPCRRLLSLLSRYSLIFLAQGMLFFAVCYHQLAWPCQGQFVIVLIAQYLMVIACMIIGALLYFLALNTVRAISMATAFTAPGFAFVGVTFPYSDMNHFAQCWHQLLPASHYTQIQIEQVNYGKALGNSLGCFAPFLGYLIPLGLLIWLLHQRASQAQAEGMCQ